MAEATAAYRSDSDHVGRFLDECCVTGIQDAKAKTTAVQAAYRQWAEREGHRPMSNVWFGRELKRRGYAAQKGDRARFYPFGLLAHHTDEQ